MIRRTELLISMSMALSCLLCSGCSFKQGVTLAAWSRNVGHAKVCVKHKRYKEAEESYAQALKITEGTTWPIKPSFEFETFHGLSLCYLEEGKSAEAASTLDKAITVAQSIWGDEGKTLDPVNSARYAECCNKLAELKHKDKADAAAKELYQHALRLEKRHNLNTDTTQSGLASL